MAKNEILLESGTNELEILEFFVNEHAQDGQGIEPCYFGVNVAKVMQVIESPELEHRESAPHPCFLGTIPLRDIILPVLDLGVWLGLDKVKSPNEVVVVTEFSQQVSGFLVSGVTEIHRVGWAEVLPPSGFMGRMDAAAIIGIVNKNDRFIQLLDLEHIISDLDPEVAESSWKTDVSTDKAYKALVADDSATIRLMLKKNLESAGFSLTMANNGDEALKLLQKYKAEATAEGRAITDYINILISDIEMPLMDGFSLTKMVKEDDMLYDIPVILYSSIITKELRHKGESVKADDQVAKPDLNSMAQRAVQLIEKRA
ncbi:MAG: chemotaxis protein [Desulfovibrionaceae bacterium]